MRRILLAATIGTLLLSDPNIPGARAQATDVGSWTVPASTTQTHSRFFRAGELVTVVVSGDGDTDLDLFVRCPLHNQVIAQDIRPGDDCAVQFRAPETGYYRISVVNLGDVYNDYSILID